MSATILHWLPIYAAMPTVKQPVEWVGPHGETIAGIYLGGDRWQRCNTGLMVQGGETPSLWRPRHINPAGTPS